MARRANQMLAGLRIVREWLCVLHSNGADAAEQQRLHDATSKRVGVLHGGNPFARNRRKARFAHGSQAA